MKKILLVEDDKKFSAMLQRYLGESRFLVTPCFDGGTALTINQQEAFDLIILDLMLPDRSGLDICQEIRKSSCIPILMLTAKGDAYDKVVGLELGADDYMSKPFEPRELLARIRALLRRSEYQKTLQEDEFENFGRLRLDHNAMQVFLDDKICDLTTYQFQLLSLLSKKPGRSLSRDYIISQLQGASIDAFDRSIDVHISRIRAEIEDNPKKPLRVITVRGVGYVFAKKQA